MKVSYATALLLAIVAAATSSEVQKSTAAAASAPSSVQSPTPFPGQGGVPYPAQSYQYTSDYAGPLAKSSFGPKATVPSSAFAAYQPYQHHQQYNFGPHQQYYPASGYPAAGPYPTAYSTQPSTGVAYPTPYSAFPYPAQPYHGGSYSPYPAAFPSYYNGQFGSPSAAAAAPYNGHYSAASPTVTPYSSLPSAYQQQPLQHSSSFYNSGAAGQQYGLSQQYLSQQQYPSQQYQSFYGANLPAAPVAATATDAVKASAERK